MHENRIEQLGVDLLLRLTETDQDPLQLRCRLGELVGIVDDAHRLVEGADAWAVLQEMLEALPSNGHLVVSWQPWHPSGRSTTTSSAPSVVR